MHIIAAALLLLSLLAAATSYRLYSILPSKQQRRTPPKRTGPCSTAILLGSGGHTAELLQLASSLPTQRYTPRSYIISAGDKFSADKAHAAEQQRRREEPNDDDDDDAPSDFSIYTLPRARAVHQSFVTAPVSVLLSLAGCTRLLVLPVVSRKLGWRVPGTGATPLPELILMNGPGTCVPVVLAVYILRFFGLPSPTLLYVESFARVQTLSLTGKLVNLLVDRFVVQWPQAAAAGRAGKDGLKRREQEVEGWWLV